MALATLIKPMLAAGDLRVIGSTTFEEFKHVEKDRALARRLQRITIEEPSVEETVKILGGLKSRYEQHLLALGGRLLRSNLRLSLDGAGSACRLDGLFLADGDRQVDLLTQVEHSGSATETLQDYRGIAAGRGRGGFNGRITVQPTAFRNARAQ
jgi:Fe-S cluster assembly scaffold protein SufB